MKRLCVPVSYYILIVYITCVYFFFYLNLVSPQMSYIYILIVILFLQQFQYIKTNGLLTFCTHRKLSNTFTNRSKSSWTCCIAINQPEICCTIYYIYCFELPGNYTQHAIKDNICVICCPTTICNLVYICSCEQRFHFCMALHYSGVHQQHTH